VEREYKHIPLFFVFVFTFLSFDSLLTPTSFLFFFFFSLKNTDPFKLIEKLTEMFALAKTPEFQAELLIPLISVHFDVNRSATVYMPLPTWKNTYDYLNRLLQILETNQTIILQEVDEVEPAPAEAPTEEDQEQQEQEQEEKLVSGNLMSFIERLDDEFLKSLQMMDPHTSDYVIRLQSEIPFIELAGRAQNYYERTNQMKRAARIAARIIEHVYYKRDERISVAVAERQRLDATQSSLEGKVTIDSRAWLERLAQLIYKHGNERLKARAMLCQIYHHALHDRFYEARDLMLMSHLQESISHTDIPTQILFNRTMAQLGLCAFRSNLIKQAHSALAELYSTNRLKELLAQGITSQRYTDRTPEQEKQERRRQLPYHMHINLDLLEAVHLICAMLLEVPNMAANQFDPKKKVISRNFHRHLDYWDRQVFTGPPENTRDSVICAAKALSKGDWKRCEALLLALPMWTLMTNSDQVKAMLTRRIQEEGLRTWIFTYGPNYDSLSLAQLAEMFSLPKNVVHSVVSKMMISEELHASWDQPSGAIIMHRVDPTKLQYLAMQFADKAAIFVENNERYLDSRTGGYGYKFDSKPSTQKDGRWQQDGRSSGRTQDRDRPRQQQQQRKQPRDGFQAYTKKQYSKDKDRALIHSQ
jgi:translation initiation factor 3 subunit C